MNNYIVYKHKNKVNGKIYIGLTNNPKRRWRLDGIEYKSSSNPNLPFWNAIQKYGWNQFSTEIMADKLTYEQSCDLERYYISLFQSTNKKYGYNVAAGGNGGLLYKEHPRGMLGKSHSQETKEKISCFMKNNNHMHEGFWDDNGGHPKGMLGKSHDIETKEKISRTLRLKKVNCKPVDLIFPNGEIKSFDSQNDCAEYLNTTTCSSMFIRLIKTGEPLEIKYKNQYTKKLIPFLGIRLIDKSKENIEVNQSSKKD